MNDMWLFDKPEGLKALKPHLPKLRNCIELAWKDYSEKYSTMRHVHDQRTRANIVYSHMAHHAMRLFDGVNGVKPIRKRGLFILHFAAGLQVRFKKFHDGKYASNYPTNQAIAFVRQVDLPGIPRATRLFVGYQLDQFETKLMSVSVTCPSGRRRNAWEFEIPEQSADNLVPFPSEKHAPDNRPIRTRVRPKKSVVMKKSNETPEK